MAILYFLTNEFIHWSGRKKKVPGLLQKQWVILNQASLGIISDQVQRHCLVILARSCSQEARRGKMPQWGSSWLESLPGYVQLYNCDTVTTRLAPQTFFFFFPPRMMENQDGTGQILNLIERNRKKFYLNNTIKYLISEIDTDRTEFRTGSFRP